MEKYQTQNPQEIPLDYHIYNFLSKVRHHQNAEDLLRFLKACCITCVLGPYELIHTQGACAILSRKKAQDVSQLSGINKAVQSSFGLFELSDGKICHIIYLFESIHTSCGHRPPLEFRFTQREPEISWFSSCFLGSCCWLPVLPLCPQIHFACQKSWCNCSKGLWVWGKRFPFFLTKLI